MLLFKLRHLRSFTSILAIVAMVMALATPCLAGPAPPISFVEILAIASQQDPGGVPVYSGEYSVQGQGGSYVLVETFEYGYGQPVSVTLGGRIGTLYAQQPYAPYGTVLGYYKVWLFQGSNLSGEFVYNVRSINSPFNTMTAWIWIY